MRCNEFIGVSDYKKNQVLTMEALTGAAGPRASAQRSKSSCWGDGYLCSYTNILLPHLPKQICGGPSSIDSNSLLMYM